MLLPTIQQLARAVAIVRAAAEQWGVPIFRKDLQQAGLWALDLTSANHRMAAARHT